MNLRKYRYIGFAGPFAEDFKLVHAHFGITRFTSIEIDENVFKRQKWNTPLRGIEYLQCDARNFVESYVASEPSVIWLDYTEPKTLADQLSEATMLVSKCADYDVIKFTFNASPHTLGADNETERIEKAKRRLGDHLPDGFEITADDVDTKGYPSLILKAAEYAIKFGMKGKASSCFQLLSCFTYADSNHRMLTLAGIVLPKRKVSAFLKETGVGGWKLAITKWDSNRTKPIEIAIPQMSLRERLFVDQQLPRRGSPARIKKKLGFNLEPGADSKTLQALESYRDFYRYFPYFSKMIV